MGGLGCGLMRTGVWFWDGNDWVWVKGSHIQHFGGYATFQFSGQSARRLSNDHHTASAASKIRCGLAHIVVFCRRSSILSLDVPTLPAMTVPTHPASTLPRSALLTTPPTKQQPTQPIYHPHHRSTHALALTHRPSTFPTHKVSASPSPSRSNQALPTRLSRGLSRTFASRGPGMHGHYSRPLAQRSAR